MEDNVFTGMLNDLYEKEQSLRKLEEEKYGRKVELSFMLGFCLCLYYKRIIFVKDGWSVNDIERDILSSDHPSKDVLLDIWKENWSQDPYLEKFVKLLSTYDFTQFTTENDEVVFTNWVNKRYLFQVYELLVSHDNVIASLWLVSNCQKQLGIDIAKGNILLNFNEPDITRHIFSTPYKGCNYSFYGLEGDVKTMMTLNVTLFNRYSHITVIDKESDDSILPSEGNYDGVIFSCKNEELNYSIPKVLSIVKEGGFSIGLFGNHNTSLAREFYDYEVPLMLNMSDYGNAILIRKVKDESNLVRYGSFNGNIFVLEYPHWIEKWTECIKNSITTSFYQELRKEDFANTGHVLFKDVKRLPDQLNFVWKKKEDVYSITEEAEEWLYNAEIDDTKIIAFQQLSGDPFKITASQSYYLNNFANKGNEEPHPLDACKIKRTAKYEYSHSIQEKYTVLFNNLYGYEGKIETEDDKVFDKQLCCRVVKSPCLLYDGARRVLRVNASEKHPICFKKYFFTFNEDYGGGIEGHSVCDVININPEYDENFIIYQLIKQKSTFSKYILVAPTKEEQHTYFLNKRLDYLSLFQPVVEEMENEVSKSISESPAYITGIGFHNFRRFASLPLMPLHGVNILVGGNNAGKSTFVKGMLLAIDNIKSYILDNNDNTLLSTKFHFDTRNYHDVRVGTFDRSYSYNPILRKDDPDRRTMSFTLSCAHFVIELNIEPSDNMADQTAVPVVSISVKDTKRNAEFCFDFKNMSTSATFDIEGERVQYQYTGLNFSMTKLVSNLIPVMIRSIIPSGKAVFLQDKALTEKLKAKAGFILEVADELERIITNINIEYIYAHGVTQKVLFNINDKNDYMAQTLHDFIVEKTGDVEDQFIKKCLNDFGLGTDYDVHSIGGEAYIIQIKNRNGRMVYLADLGMGTNQLVILIFRLAIIIHKQRMRGATPYKPTIIIEEPEQNMHPAFQSKLATLFYEVNRDYGFSFIVETHSEYLVRKSQVIVAQQKYSEEELRGKNPFTVYYFPTDGTPYEMTYRTDGNFSNDFGSGFYDEANNLLFEII